MQRQASPLDRGVLGGLAGFRAVAWVWMATVLFASREDLSHPAAAAALLCLALLLTAALALVARFRPDLLIHPGVIAVEVGMAVTLLVADGWVYGGDHGQTLGSAWPLAAVLAVGAAWGPVAGIAAGVALGVGKWGGTHLDDLASPGLLSLLSTTVLYCLAGGAAGLVLERLRRSEDEIAAARTRQDIARTLHNGVLQTLAVVQRRSSDPDLAELARTQERELREFLFGVERAPGDLLTELRRVAARAESRHGITVQVTAVEEPGAVASATVAAVAGAVGEALTNAAKHGDATRVIVLVDPGDDGTVTVSVNDDGGGFDPGSTDDGAGLTGSIRGRMAEVGGQVEIDSAPGRGAEVRLLLPS
ncbi:hypothetical protein BH24ACT4_BH24ACT4_22840 [soil metagenome]